MYIIYMCVHCACTYVYLYICVCICICMQSDLCCPQFWGRSLVRPTYVSAVGPLLSTLLLSADLDCPRFLGLRFSVPRFKGW